MSRFMHWFLRMDVKYDASDITLGSPMFWRAVQVVGIIVFIMVLFSFVAQASSLSQDGAGTWRINTFGTTDRVNQYMYGGVHQKGGFVHRSYYGFVEAMECSTNIVEQKARAKRKLLHLLDTVLYATQNDRAYSISIAVSVCNPDHYVIYLHDGINYASRGVYNSIILELE